MHVRSSLCFCAKFVDTHIAHEDGTVLLTKVAVHALNTNSVA